MCLYPKLVQNKKYTATKKNKGIVPTPTDARTLFVPVGCGKCMECKKQKARNWRVRLQEELKSNNTAQFVTLSFSNQSLTELGKGIKLTGYNLDNEICRKAIRLFLERWRKETTKSCKHWFVTEIGGQRTERIHIHGLMFTANKELIKNKWQYGNVFIGEYVNQKTINYIVKYLHKTDEKHKYYNSKIFASPAIGDNFINRKDATRSKIKDNYKAQNGMITALPVYYRNKLHSETEREELWLKMLDKQVRYVNGIEIDVSKGLENYNRAIEEARVLNKELGYGDDEKNWEEQQYENSLRAMGQIIKAKKRIEKQGAAI